MTRVTTTILAFMLLMNASVTIMEGSGLTDDLGVTLAPGVDQAMEKVTNNMKDGFSPTGGLGETLFSLFAAGLGVFEVAVNGLYAFPQMFMNLGFPHWFVIPVFAPAYLISTLELVYMATGRLGA